MFTSVTNKTYGKACLINLGMTIFCLVFTYIYEQFSYGQFSLYMRLMFLAPLLASILYLLSGFKLTWLRHRLSILLFNSSLAIILSACLVKGIIEVSGRTTTYEQSYWYAGLAFFSLSILSSVKTPKLIKD